MIDQQLFVERMLESENLTDELEDDDANWLLNWGIGQIGHVIEVKQDLEAAAERVNALMQFMRLLNRIGGNPASISPGVIPELLERHSAAFGASYSPSEIKCQQVVETLPAMTSRQAMEFIINWASNH
jgi:hypothetical protein